MALDALEVRSVLKSAISVWPSLLTVRAMNVVKREMVGIIIQSLKLVTSSQFQKFYFNFSPSPEQLSVTMQIKFEQEL